MAFSGFDKASAKPTVSRTTSPVEVMVVHSMQYSPHCSAYTYARDSAANTVRWACADTQLVTCTSRAPSDESKELRTSLVL